MKLTQKVKGYGRYLSLLAKTKFSRKFKRKKNLLITALSVSRKLARYLGEEEGGYGDSHFTYRIKDNEGHFYRITYSDNYGAEELPNSKMEMFKRLGKDDWALVSRFSPTLDMIFPGFNNHYWGNLPVRLGGDIDPHHVLLAFTEYYANNKEKIEKEIENTPRFILEKLNEDFPYIESLKSLNKFQDSFLNSEDLRDLEGKLKKVDSLKDYTTLKTRKAEELTQKLWKKYNDAEEEQRIEKLREKEKVAKQAKLEEIAQVTVKRRKPTKSSGQGIAGYRRDIGFNARSIWEANYARVLMWQGIPFSYESKTFDMEVPEDMKTLFNGKEKISYIPDFKIKNINKFVEVKGNWFNYNAEEAMAKIILFKRKNPNIELEVVGIQAYKSLEDHFKDKINNSPAFCGWENGGRKQGDNLFTNPEKFE